MAALLPDILAVIMFLVMIALHVTFFPKSGLKGWPAGRAEFVKATLRNGEQEQRSQHHAPLDQHHRAQHRGRAIRFLRFYPLRWQPSGAGTGWALMAGVLRDNRQRQCASGHCIPAISIRKAWLPYGGKPCWRKRCCVARHGAIGIIRNWIVSGINPHRWRRWRCT